VNGTELLSPIVGGIAASGVGLPELVWDICKILHHPALTFPYLTPLPFLFLPPLKRGSRTIEGVNSARRVLSRSIGTLAAVSVDVLRIHLRMHRNARERKDKAEQNRRE
jgi:hypothetical protein